MTTTHAPNRLAAEEVFRILLATDDSDPARCAEAWATRLITGMPRIVEVVCVAGRGLTRFGWAMESYRPAVKDALEQVRRGELLAAERTANAVGDRLQAAGLRVHTWTRQGDTPDELLAMVVDDEPDLVVVGPRGRSALSELLLGSVSHELVSQSPRPILVARRPATEDGALPGRAVLLLSGTRADVVATRWLADSGVLASADVIAVSVHDTDLPVTASSLSELDDRLRWEMDEHVAAALVPLVGQVRSLERRVVHGHELEETLEVTRRSEADLVIATRPVRRRGRRAIAEELAHHAPCSVLVVPTP